jgi:MFS family permease
MLPSWSSARIDRAGIVAALFPASANADARRLIWAKGLRAIADGYVSVLLPAYLLRLGYDSVEVGLLAAATLLGSATLTMFAGFAIVRLGQRRALLAASALMAMTGLGFAGLRSFWPLLVVTFVGTLNPSSGDVSIFLPLEQSLLSGSVASRDRTTLFARYSLAGGLMGAVGTLLAGVPDFLETSLSVAPLLAMQFMFLLYALIGAAAGLIYRGLADRGGAPRSSAGASLGPSRGIVYRLTALFCVDAFGGGFLVQAILALWLLRDFQLPLSTTAAIFFCSNLLSAASYVAAPPLARRIGLVNTMVFTHLPSSLCLIAVPFLHDLNAVVALLLIRSLLSQMDVPTRTSFVMAVVTPPERAAAASLTSVPRSLAAAISPVVAGYVIALSTFGWPLLAGGMLKIVYDLTLLAMFRPLRPPEELDGTKSS